MKAEKIEYKGYEQEYECKCCGHKQTVKFFKSDEPFPALCCVQCRAGFDTSFGTQGMGEMMAKRQGMFPVGEQQPYL